jgi:hypothetical protein
LHLHLFTAYYVPIYLQFFFLSSFLYIFCHGFFTSFFPFLLYSSPPLSSLISFTRLLMILNISITWQSSLVRTECE